MIAEIKNELEKIKAECINQIAQTDSSTALYNIKVQFLGKSGKLTAQLKNLRNFSDDDKKIIGQVVNQVKADLENEFSKKEKALYSIELEKKLQNEKIDITINRPGFIMGKPHPLDVLLKRINSFFVANGFIIQETREIETSFYNFDALNTPADHPAREAQDTFFLEGGAGNILLRSQTSTGQIRYMQENKPPIKLISPGRVYRADEVDATHTPCFHQLEGLVVAKGINMGHLKGTILEFMKFLFDEKTKIRFRPSFFPFTEPSVEVDASCFSCKDGNIDPACKICKGTGFLEIMGAGMVNRQVLKNVEIDPDEYSGFAFGMGLDRVMAILHGINDARVSFEGDIRFLKQF
ncbi:MAG: phenylalanine--tRNA ligase subunit alpha [Firmicutes bacterium]|nr:phenylalanine--tRNA ligase subunit alpha [Bacillota bacterium]